MKNEIVSVLGDILKHYSTSDTSKFDQIKDILSKVDGLESLNGIMNIVGGSMGMMGAVKGMSGLMGGISNILGSDNGTEIIDKAKASLESFIKDGSLEPTIKLVIEKVLEVIKK